MYIFKFIREVKMRTKNSIKNAKYNLIFTFLNMILTFISRSVFTTYLGIEIVGINSVLLSIIGILNLVDLGIGSAIAYSLYDPIRSKNKEKIGDIMVMFDKLYKAIGVATLILGILTIPFLDNIIKSNIEINRIVIYFYMYVLNLSITYLFTSKQVLLNADQKQYYISKINGKLNILKTIVQVISIIIFKKYIIWISLEIIFNLFKIILINKTINNIYSREYFRSDKKLKQLIKSNINIMNNTKNIFIHKVASFIVYQMDSFTVSIMFNLKYVGIYSNYMIVFNSLVNLVGQVINALSASLGNLVAEKNDNKSFEVWKELISFEIFIASIISYCTYKLFNPFISVWIGSEYLFSQDIVFIVALNLYIFLTRGITGQFKSVYGIFNDIYSPILEGLINIIFSIILAKNMGIIGIFIGTLISNLCIVSIWIPYITFKKGFKKSFINYIKYYGKYTFISLISMVISDIIYKNIPISININSILDIFTLASIIFITISIISMVLFMKDKTFKNFFNRTVFALKNI